MLEEIHKFLKANFPIVIGINPGEEAATFFRSEFAMTEFFGS